MNSLNSNSIIGLIPARGGSKGIKNKNLHPLNGRPLIAYTIEASLASELSSIIVSSDNSTILDFAKELSTKHPQGKKLILHQRESHLAQDNSTLIELVKSLIQSKVLNTNQPLMLLQPTSPLRNKDHINQAIASFIEKHAESLVSVCPPLQHPSDMIVKDDKFSFLIQRTPETQRQSYQQTYFVNGAIYLTQLGRLLRTNSFYDEQTEIYIMPKMNSFDIDEPEDLEIAELLIRGKNL